MTTPRLVCVLVSVLCAIAPVHSQDLTPLVSGSESMATVSLRPDGRPGFLRGQWPGEAQVPRVTDDPTAAATAFLEPHARALGLDLSTTRLEWSRTEADTVGRHHTRFAQSYRGVPVLAAQLLMHHLPDATTVYALNGRWAESLEIDTTPRTGTARAWLRAKRDFPSGRLEGPPRLVVVTDQVTSFLAGDHLAWELVLQDPTIPERSLYLVDASDLSILFKLDLLETARDRLTYTADNLLTLPGTLMRSEGQGPVGDIEVDQAHDFAGATYDYYSDQHGRDSLDDAGAQLISTAHYGTGYANAFWNGTQMVYGEGYATLDVCAHELTHGVTEFSASLIYFSEPGALNESFSDLFAAMVDDDDWLVGEDLPIGAIRSLEDPTQFGDPDHLDSYFCGFFDNAGVHINSGIQNKAAYLLATATSREAAGAIFYRSLTTYLFPSAVFIDARDAATHAAIDLYGAGSAEHAATIAAFDAVGLDAGSLGPDCELCPTQAVAASEARAGNTERARVMVSTARRVRDELLARSVDGRRMRDLYYEHGPRIVSATARSPRLLLLAADLLRELKPGLDALLQDRGDQVVLDGRTVRLARRLLNGLAAADPVLADAIVREQYRERLWQLGGKRYGEAMELLTNRSVPPDAPKGQE